MRDLRVSVSRIVFHPIVVIKRVLDFDLDELTVSGEGFLRSSKKRDLGNLVDDRRIPVLHYLTVAKFLVVQFLRESS